MATGPWISNPVVSSLFRGFESILNSLSAGLPIHPPCSPCQVSPISTFLSGGSRREMDHTVNRIRHTYCKTQMLTRTESESCTTPFTDSPFESTGHRFFFSHVFDCPPSLQHQ